MQNNRDEFLCGLCTGIILSIQQFDHSNDLTTRKNSELNKPVMATGLSARLACHQPCGKGSSLPISFTSNLECLNIAIACRWEFRINRPGAPTIKYTKYCKGTTTINHSNRTAQIEVNKITVMSESKSGLCTVFWSSLFKCVPNV